MAVEKFTEGNEITYTFSSEEVQRAINAGIINPPSGSYATTGAVIFTEKQFANEYDSKIRDAGLPLKEVLQG